MNSGCTIGISAYAVDFRHAQRCAQGGNHIGLPLQNGVSVGADLRVCSPLACRNHIAKALVTGGRLCPSLSPA